MKKKITIAYIVIKKKETMNFNDLPFIQSFKVKNQIDSIIFYYQYHRFEFTKNEEQI